MDIPNTRVSNLETAIDKPMSEAAARTFLDVLEKGLDIEAMSQQSITTKSDTLSPFEAAVFFLCGNATSEAARSDYGGAIPLVKATLKATLEERNDKPLADACFDMGGSLDNAKLPSIVMLSNNVKARIYNNLESHAERAAVTPTLVDAILAAGTEMGAKRDTQTQLNAVELNADGQGRA